MRLKFGYAATIFAVLLAGCSGSSEPKLEPEAGDGYLFLYSTSEKPFRCALNIKFVYTDDKGERKPGSYLCFERDHPAGTRVKICEVRIAELIAPVVEEIEKVKCSPPTAG